MASVITNPTIVLQYRAFGAGTVPGNSFETLTLDDRVRLADVLARRVGDMGRSYFRCRLIR